MPIGREIEVVLRSMLFQAKCAESLEEVVAALEVMCTKEDIATVNEQIEALKAKKSKQ